jgi:predicted dehydrogenase
MLKIGLLGCGFIAQQSHLPALQKADGVKLNAICDLSPDLTRRVAEIYQVDAAYNDVQTFLGKSDIEAVLVAVNDQDHLPLVAACLEAGKHVLVEKPLTMTLDEAEQLIKIIEKSGLQVQVGFMERYDPANQFAQKFVSEQMGERLSLSSWYCDSAVRPQVQKTLLTPPIPNHMPKPSGPDPKADLLAYKLRTHGAHPVDLLRFFGGDIAGLQAHLAYKYSNFSWHVLLEFTDGASGSLELTIASRMDWLEGYRIHGQYGSVLGDQPFHFNRQPAQVKVFDARRGEYITPCTPDSDAYERQIEAFADAITNGRPVTPDAMDGFACQRVLHAIAESSANGKWVKL